MNPEKDIAIQFKRLSNETDYFNNVFKKTEKVVSVIFYILSHIGTTPINETHVSLIKDRTLKIHEVSLATLRLRDGEVGEGLLLLQYALVDLESTLRVAQASGVISTHIAQLIFEQLISIERYLKHHYLTEEKITFEETLSIDGKKPARLVSQKQKEASAITPRRRNVHIPAGDISSDAYMVYSQLTDRADRIKTVLEAKPQATIRDIAEIITDVSEKTIQRELNSLIEKGQVIREGERRWSKYSAKK
jgi:DNA-binding transcriptional ArsR family regulator